MHILLAWIDFRYSDLPNKFMIADLNPKALDLSFASTILE